MNLDEFKDAKRLAELEVAQQLQESLKKFFMLTGVAVTAVSIEVVATNSYSSEQATPFHYYVSGVKLEVAL